MNDLTICMIQMDAGTDVAGNLARVGELLEKTPPCDVVVLPEVFSVRGNEEDYRGAAELIPGPTTGVIAEMAASRSSWVLAGSVIEKEGGKNYNTSVLFDRTGRIAATYRKIHLFEATLDTGEVICEGDSYSAGSEPVLADIEGWRCGMAICYDLRFPELFRHYVAEGAHLFFVPSNFTQRTGKDHWEVLVCARAIENQCFVIAPDQCGMNARTGVESHGHSLAVDPWGDILGRGGVNEEVITVRIDAERLRSVRARIPVLRGVGV